MFRTYVLVTVVTAAANVYAAIADLIRPKWLLNNMAEVRVPRPWLPFLAVLKGAGAAGLVLGLMGFRAAGRAAASGLALFFIGAIATHLRARAFHNIAFPSAYLALALASLTLSGHQPPSSPERGMRNESARSSTNHPVVADASR